MQNPRPLDETRAEITALDQKIQALFLRRMACAQEVAAYKLQTGDAILKPDREQYLLDTLDAQVPSTLHQEYRSMLKTIMRVSRKYQYTQTLQQQPSRFLPRYTSHNAHPDVVVYQGLPASYQFQAATAMFPQAKAINHANTFEDVFQLVTSKHADVGILPIENSTVGPINEVCDLLAKYNLFICHSYVQSIANCLCACQGASLAQIETVYSIQPALGQCQNFLKSHSFAQKEVSNTAVAAKLVAESQDCSLAAVCSAYAAQQYGLQILAHNINDDSKNQTRFIAIARNLSAEPTDNRISLVFTLPHNRGSLAAALSICADHEVNLTEIHSRPLPETPWNYRFHIDLEGSLCDPAVCTMIYQLQEELSTVQILGSYSISDSTETR